MHFWRQLIAGMLLLSFGMYHITLRLPDPACDTSALFLFHLLLQLLLEAPRRLSRLLLFLLSFSSSLRFIVVTRSVVIVVSVRNKMIR